MTVAQRPSRDRPQDVAPSGAEAFAFHLLVELSDFRELRRRLGCSTAATLVCGVAERLEDLLPGAIVTIVGQAVVACRLHGWAAGNLDTHVAAIKRAFLAPLEVAGERHNLNLAFGASTAPRDGLDEVQLVETAEAALDAARTGAAKSVVTADLPVDAIQFARELEQAIDREELVLLYQPKIHVRRQEIGSAEALVRWRHPERGMILPGDFIPMAEECQLIDRMTLWVIRQAIADQRILAASGHDLRLFINISGQLLADAAFVRAACDLVGGSDTKLGFEITETSVIRDPESAIANLQLFADFGITIAIDDYGAGLSSLAYLKQLPARELKIDKLFVTQLTSSNRDPLIVRSTIDLAHALEMEVVAEGVETHAALALLTVMGCDMVQGFLISRPVELNALVTYLHDGRHHASVSETGQSLSRFAARK